MAQQNQNKTLNGALELLIDIGFEGAAEAHLVAAQHRHGGRSAAPTWPRALRAYRGPAGLCQRLQGQNFKDPARSAAAEGPADARLWLLPEEPREGPALGASPGALDGGDVRPGRLHPPGQECGGRAVRPGGELHPGLPGRRELDEMLEAWRTRPLERYPYVVLDAQYQKVRQGGRVRDAAVLIAAGVGTRRHT